MLLTAQTQAKSCEEDTVQYDDYGWKDIAYCIDGVVRKEVSIHLKSGATTKLQLNNEKGQVIESKSWSIEGRFTYWAKFSYVSSEKQIEELFSTLPDSKFGMVRARSEYDISGAEKVVLKEWIFSNSSLRPLAIRHFKKNEQKPGRIDVLSKEGKVVKYYLVKYNKEAPMAANLVNEFKAYTPSGELLGSYNESLDFNVEKVLSSYNLSKKEFERRLAVFNDTTREPVVIIDTGFDISHPSLAHKLYRSPFDIPYDGIDNDNNGRVDDSWGWHRQDDAGLSLLRDDNNISETHSLIHTPYPVSHGTHVASLALKDLDNYGLVGFAGDVAIYDHLLSAGEYIKNKKIKFVNMSFAIGFPGAPMSAPRDSFTALESIFANNPETLFVVAAGNGRGALDLDEPGNNNYPASYTYANMLKVGAINTAELEDGKFDEYKPAFFSKFGVTKVQVFAPGQGVLSAQSGGGEIALNGTSMASPYVLNVVLKGHNINSALSALELKEVLMKTVYIPSSGRLPCESGGIVAPNRFYKALELMKKGLDKEEAINKANLLNPSK